MYRMDNHVALTVIVHELYRRRNLRRAAKGLAAVDLCSIPREEASRIRASSLAKGILKVRMNLSQLKRLSAPYLD